MLSPDGIALRGLFIIDKEGVVQHSTINNLAFGRNVDEVLRTLQALQYVQEHPDEVCPAGWKPGEWRRGADKWGAAEVEKQVAGRLGCPADATLTCWSLMPRRKLARQLPFPPCIPTRPPRRRQDHEARCRPGVLRRHLSGPPSMALR